jgi:Bacterial protein of unknown function (DUF937)
MSLLDILETAEGGKFFANAGAACGVDAATARRVSERVAPAIANRIKDKSVEDPANFEALLDMLEDDGNVDLQAEGSLTDHDAQIDGAEILNDLYGSAAATNAVFKGMGGGVDKAALSTLTAINATAVLAVLAASNAQALTGAAAKAADTGKSGRGLLSIIITALLNGLMQGVARQLAPKRRRRRYTSYFGRRAPVRRKRRRSPGIDDVFKEILGGRR